MLSPRSVLITGANKGIGLEMVKQFLKLPSPPEFIFAGCRNPQQAEALSHIAEQSASVIILKLDVCDDESIASARVTVESILTGKGLTLLVNNAATLGQLQELEDVTRSDLMAVMETNTVGPIIMAKTFLPLLKRAVEEKPDSPMSCNRSAIINISSDLGSIGLNVVVCGYGYRTSKAALNMATSNFATQLKDDGILCVALHPGWVRTDLGGPNGQLAPEEAVAVLFKTIANLQGPHSSGQFYHAQTGEKMPW